MAAEVARDVRHDVHAGTPALKTLRMTFSLAATRDGRHRPRSIVLYDIVAAFVHSSIDEVVRAAPQDGLLEKGECSLLLKALCGTQMASKRWQRHHMRVLRTHAWSASKVMPGFFHHRDPAGTRGCHGDDFMVDGSDVPLDRLDRVMKDEFNAKMLGRVGRGRLTGVKFLKRTLRWHEQEMCFSGSGDTRYVTELAVLLGLNSSCDEDTNSGNEGNWWRRLRCPGADGYLSGSNLPLSRGVDRIHRPGQTRLPVMRRRR